MYYNDQLVAEHDALLSKRPSLLRVGVFTWVIWITCLVLGWIFFFVGIANFITGSVTMKILSEIIGHEDIAALGNDGTQKFIYLFSLVCFLVAVPLLFIAWLTKAVLKRNSFIIDQVEFTDKVIFKHKAVEHSLNIIQNGRRL